MQRVDGIKLMEVRTIQRLQMEPLAKRIRGN